MAVLLGEQNPRILHEPTSWNGTSSAGREAIELAAEAGLNLDPWQQNVLHGALAKRDETVYNPYTDSLEYKWAAREVGLMISRQNGKGSLLEARELAGLFLFGERLIIHSAHQFDTSKEAFERILFLIENNPDFEQEVMRVDRSHGEEGIVMKKPKGSKLPPQRLRFRTRTKGGGRGFTGDTLILDEAMILDADMVKALMPTLTARPNVQIWYTGSAGTRKSTQFGRVRARAIRGGDPLLWYGEWSADLCTPLCPPGCDEHDQPGDPRTWARANAAFGIRIEEEGIAANFRSMDPDSFAMEHLGVGDWPTEGQRWIVIGEPYWNSRFDGNSQLGPDFVLGVDFAPDRSKATLLAAGPNQHDDIHIEITGNEEIGIDNRVGVQWAEERVKHIWRTQRPRAVAIDPASQAGALIEPLETAGINVITPTSREYGLACGEFRSGVVPRKGEKAYITHIGQAELTESMAVADMRTTGDLWMWSKSLSTADITPTGAATLATWGWKKMANTKTETVATPWVFRR
ncbi:hypothetical protein GS534_24110 [Rhodococcus hoagii]|nr:hypothetical protein [Prescottella equi]NKS33115.1 hypothetical protein [Prescottella equi]